MAAKQVLISSDDITYYLLPGGGGEMTREGQAVTDTILGQSYKSAITGPVSWGINGDAIYKGFAGYVAKLLKPGTPTAAPGEAFTLVSGKTYRINAVAKRIWSRTVPIVVKDAAADHTADVLSYDPLFGTVTFKSTYTVGGAVTADVTYLPMASISKYTAFTLNQTSEPIKTSDMPTLQGNSGWDTFTPGLKTVSVELPNVFASADAWHAALAARTEYVIEVNPDGLGETAGSVARGFFRLTSVGQSGNVGALEEETLHFELNVPIQTVGPILDRPFGWVHAVASPIPVAIQKVLTAWQTDANVFARYLHDGVNGWKGSVALTNLTLSGGMDTPNVFQCNMKGSGAPVVFP
jgi:hypothetical protein